MKILVINGPNLNLLGLREPDIYGRGSYAELCGRIRGWAEALEVEVELFQSNHEGAIVDKIQSAYGVFDGILINPAAYTHTSVAILDALKAVAIPTVEVHISDVNSREEFRHYPFVSVYALRTIGGHGCVGYRTGLEALAERTKD